MEFQSGGKKAYMTIAGNPTFDILPTIRRGEGVREEFIRFIYGIVNPVIRKPTQ